MNVKHGAVLACISCVLATTAADWLYTPASYTDSDGAVWGTISDGTWTLCVTANGTALTTKGEGNTVAVPPLAVTGSGALDLSKPVYDASGTRYRLVGQRQSAFWKFSASEYGERTITSYVASPDFTEIGRNAFHTASDLASVVLDAPACVTLGYQSFRNCSSLTDVSFMLPAVGYLGVDLTAGAKIASDARAWRFDSVTNVQPFAFSSQPITGALYLPSAEVICHQSFKSCTKLKGLVLGSENPSGNGLVHIGAHAALIPDATLKDREETKIAKALASGGDINHLSAAYGVALDFLVIGKGTAQVLDNYAFSGINCITNIFFCGDKPTFGTTVFRHLEEKYAAIYIPYGNETYRAAIDSVTEPTEAERAEFEARHAPGTLIGMVNAQTHFGGNDSRKQFLAYGNYRTYLNDIVVAGTPEGVTKKSDPALYWLCNQTVRDIDPASAYTLTAPAPRLIDGTYRFVSGYTLERATRDGWTAPQKYTGETYVRPAGTKGTVRLTWIWQKTSLKAGALVQPDDATWPGDQVEIFDASGTKVAPDAYLRFGTVTLKPVWTAADGYPQNGFFRWENVPAGAVIDEDGQLTFTYDGTQSGLRAIFRHDWVYDASAGTIYNRRYRLKVTDLGEGALALGTVDAQTGETAGHGNAFIVPDGDAPLEAGGPLDLNGLITDAEGTGNWTLSQIGYRSLAPWSLVTNDDRVTTAYPTAVRLPETLEKVCGATFKTISWDYTPLTNLVVVTPYLKRTGISFAEGHRNLVCLQIDCPALDMLGQAFVCAMPSTVLKHTDVTRWNLPNLTTLGSQPFGNNCSYTFVHGTLDLPKLVTSSGQGVSALTGVETMIFGTNGCTLTTFGDKMFLNCTSLKHLTIGASGTLAFPATEFFPNGTALETLTFHANKMPSNVGPFLDAVLSYKHVSGPSDYVTVTGSKTLFKRRLAVAALTAEESAVAPEGAFGVYVPTGTDVRKAYLVDNGAIPEEFFILFR